MTKRVSSLSSVCPVPKKGGVLLRRCVLGVTLWGAVSVTQAQWAWLDASGRKVYSDQPPPVSVPEKNILKQPRQTGTSGNAAPPVADSPATTPAKASPADNGGKNELDEKKKKAEAEAEAKKQAEQRAEEQRVAKLRAENCRQAQTAKANLDTGRPMRTTDAKGEMVFMDEAMRSAEMRRIQQVMQAECGPMPATPRQ